MQRAMPASRWDTLMREKSYKPFDPVKQHIILSRSAIFDEMTLANNFLNSIPVENDRVYILVEYGSSIAIYGLSCTHSPLSCRIKNFIDNLYFSSKH